MGNHIGARLSTPVNQRTTPSEKPTEVEINSPFGICLKCIFIILLADELQVQLNLK